MFHRYDNNNDYDDDDDDDNDDDLRWIIVTKKSSKNISKHNNVFKRMSKILEIDTSVKN